MSSNMAQPNAKQGYLAPFVTMVVMMAVIGFITSINQQFQTPIRETFLSGAGALRNSFATLLTFAFFLSYFVMGPIAARFVEKRGYKMTIVQGLLILCVGVLLFIVSALLYMYAPTAVQIGAVSLPLSYFIFLIGSFVCGAGITYMQSSVNPYLIACDVTGTSAVQRQNISGVANSTMTMLAPIFVASVIFGGVAAEEVSIRDMVLPMSLLLVVIFALSFLVRRLNVPHIAGTTSEGDSVSFGKVWGIRRVRLGVIALFFYVGVEVCIGANIVMYGQDDLGLTHQQAALYASYYWLAMLIARFVSSFLSKVSDRSMLAATTAAASVLIVIAAVTRMPWFLIAIGLCHSVMWGAIYSLALKDLGSYATKASGMLLMGLVGGAILPFVQGLLADTLGSWQYTWGLVLLGELFMLYYAVVGSRIRQDNLSK